MNMARCCRGLKEFVEALQLHDRHERLAERLANSVEQQKAACERGITYIEWALASPETSSFLRRWRLQRGLQQHQRSLRLARHLPTAVQADALFNVAGAKELLHDAAAAADASRALQLRLQVRDVVGAVDAQLLLALALLLCEPPDYKGAEHACNEAQARAYTAAYDDGVVAAATNRGKVLAAQARFNEALRAYKDALGAAKQRDAIADCEHNCSTIKARFAPFRFFSF